MQARPIYSKDAYCKVQKEAVYVRRGSSTDIAKPDEIARMGTAGVDWVKKPSVELSLFDRKTGDPLDNYVSIDRCTWYDLPPNKEIPKYSPGNRDFVESNEFRMLFVSPVNTEYLQKMAEYIPGSACFALSLELRNTGEISIHDTSLVFELRDPNQRYKLLTSQDCVGKPHPIVSFHWLPPRSITEQEDVFVKKEGDAWQVKCTFGKIQPGAAVRLMDDLLIGSRFSGDANIFGKVYSDNISSPIPIRIDLSFQMGSQTLTLQELEDIATSNIGY